jgi:hypothetical protein
MFNSSLSNLDEGYVFIGPKGDSQMIDKIAELMRFYDTSHKLTQNA